MTWLVKRRRYDETETVICAAGTRETAQETADLYNEHYQSKRYYVEEYDPTKSDWLEPPC